MGLGQSRITLLLIAALPLASACSGGSGGGSIHSAQTASPDLSAVQGQITFSRHPLTGLSGPAVIPFDMPPHPVGTANDGLGNLTVLDTMTYGLQVLYATPRIAYGLGSADLNGDGLPDVISGVYSPTNMNSNAYLLLGSTSGKYTLSTSFGPQYTDPLGNVGFRGRSESIIVADFNNDGTVDVFVPNYTYLDGTYDLSGDPAFARGGAPPNVNNAYQSFLLLNDGTGHFTERAVEAGVSMHSSYSGLSPASTDPDGNQPEGAQAVDFNMDGLIDLYVGGHLYINQGVDASGVPHFKDMAAEWGLTNALLRQGPPWATGVALPPNWLVMDEGAKFLDWNNDGRLDLLIFRWNWGPAHGARLFEFTGTQFVERTQTVTQPTPTCKNPSPQSTAFFLSSRPTTTTSGAAGINAYDLDNDGLEDVVVSGDTTGASVFRNYGCGFIEVPAGGLTGTPGGSGAVAMGDFNGDGKIDIVYPESNTHEYFINTTPAGATGSFTVEVLGPNGEHNQYGRVVQVLPPGTPQIFTRVVDSGSGYLSQNQYPILIGTPFAGAHTVKVYYAPLTPCVYGGAPCVPVVLSFTVSPGQAAKTYAPSTSHPGGTVSITQGN